MVELQEIKNSGLAEHADKKLCYLVLPREKLLFLTLVFSCPIKQMKTQRMFQGINLIKHFEVPNVKRFSLTICMAAWTAKTHYL